MKQKNTCHFVLLECTAWRGGLLGRHLFGSHLAGPGFWMPNVPATILYDRYLVLQTRNAMRQLISNMNGVNFSYTPALVNYKCIGPTIRANENYLNFT